MAVEILADLFVGQGVHTERLGIVSRKGSAIQGGIISGRASPMWEHHDPAGRLRRSWPPGCSR